MEQFHGTTILSVRRGAAVALGGDGQVTLGNIVVKASARKVRRLYHDRILAGFAGGTADAFTLFERFEAKLDKHQGNLLRSAVELAKDWRTDRVLRRLEAMLAVADRESSLIITGMGDVLEPEHGHRSRSARAAPTRRPRRARCSRTPSSTPRAIVAQGARDRRRPLHLHQPPDRRRDAGLARRSSHVVDDAAGNRPRARQAHRRPGRAPSAPSRSRCSNRWRRQQVAEPLRQEITPKNILMIGPDRRRQDRDRAAPGAARRRAVHQGRGDQVHRGRLRRPRRRHHRPRPGRDRDQAHARGGDEEGAHAAPRTRPRSACSTCCCRRRARSLRPRRQARSRRDEESATRQKFRKKLREGELDDKEIEIEVAAAAGADGDPRAARHGGADRSRSRACSRTSAAAGRSCAS